MESQSVFQAETQAKNLSIESPPRTLRIGLIPQLAEGGHVVEVSLPAVAGGVAGRHAVDLVGRAGEVQCVCWVRCSSVPRNISK